MAKCGGAVLVEGDGSVPVAGVGGWLSFGEHICCREGAALSAGAWPDVGARCDAMDGGRIKLI